MDLRKKPDRSEIEDEHQGLVHGAQFAGVQPSGRPAESLRVDDRRLLDEGEAFVRDRASRGAAGSP